MVNPHPFVERFQAGSGVILRDASTHWPLLTIWSYLLMDNESPQRGRGCVGNGGWREKQNINTWRIGCCDKFNAQSQKNNGPKNGEVPQSDHSEGWKTFCWTKEEWQHLRDFGKDFRLAVILICLTISWPLLRSVAGLSCVGWVIKFDQRFCFENFSLGWWYINVYNKLKKKKKLCQKPIVTVLCFSFLASSSVHVQFFCTFLHMYVKWKTL